MPDWKRYVREHLPPLALDAERELEIVEELAAHLEAIHEAALAEGVPEQGVERRVAAQVADWRLLECEVNRAERGIIQTASRWQAASQWAQPDEGTRGGFTMKSFLQDLRYGARMLVKSPGFTLIAVFSLALGIGASTAIFSLADKLLLRLLPVKDLEQLVVMTAESVNPRFLNTIFSYPDYADYRDRNQVLSGLVAYAQINGKLGAGEQTEPVRLEMVSGNYFDVLGVRPALGRTFLPEEYKAPGTHPVVVLSYGFWRQRFGGDLGVLGKTVTLNNASYTVIGVAQPGFEGTRIERTTELWTPVMMRQQVFGGSATSVFEHKSAWLRLMGRLKPGVSLEQARTSLDLLARQIWEANTPQSDRNLPFNEKRVLLEPGGKGLSTLRNELGKPLKMLMAVTMLVLLIACANVATLLLARSTARRKEIAVRLALGASRFRIVRQLLTESVLLAMISAAAGVVVINEAMARRYFPNQNPVGKRMSMGPGMPWMEIIGVAADVKSRELTKEAVPHFDQPALQRPYANFAEVLVRTRSDAAAIALAVRREVAAGEPGASIANIRSLSEDFRDSISTARMATMLMSLFGAIALSLASLGLYGVMAYSVTRRTHEIGIRMALGAQAGDVQRLILGQGMKLTSFGMAIGLIAAFALTRLIRSLLYGVSATDPVTFIAIALLLAMVALLANWIPARRATKVDPMVALRQE